MKKSTSGFTIVELLIVIVVIGILAAIVIVAFNGIQTRAQNNSRIVEMKAWEKLFIAYKAANGSLPTMAGGTTYCLGTGFPTGPSGGGIARCRDYNGTGTTSFAESSGASIITALSTIGKVPSSEKIPVNGTVGPYIQYTAGSGGAIVGWFNGGSTDCPTGTTYSWDDGNGRVGCYIFVSE